MSEGARNRLYGIGLVGLALLGLWLPVIAPGPWGWAPIAVLISVAAFRRDAVATFTIATLGSFALFGDTLRPATAPAADTATMPSWAAMTLAAYWLLAMLALRGRTAGSSAQTASANRDGDAASLERFRQIIEQTEAITLIVDPGLQIRYANPAAERMLESAPGTLCGVAPGTLTHPDDSAQLDQLLRRCARDPGTAQSMPRLRMRTAADGWAWVDARIAALTDEPGCDLVISGAEITGQVQAENALRRSETRFASLFEASRDALVIARASDGITLDFNDAFSELTGWSRESGIGVAADQLTRFADPADLDRIGDAIERDGEVSGFESVLVTRDGRAREVSLSGRYGEIDGALCIVTVLRDISESRRTEAALRESEEKFLRVFNRSPDAMCITRLADFVVLDVNDHLVDLFGIDRSILIGRPLSDFRSAFGDDVLERHERLLAEVGDDDVAGYANLETEIRSASATIPVLVSSTVVEINGEACAISLLKDMSDLRRAQAQLEESEARFRGAFEHAPIGMMLVNPDDDSITQVNRILCDLLGRAPHELLGSSAEGLVPEEDRSAYTAFRDAILQGHGEDDLIESRFQRSDGSILWANRHMVVQRSSDGTPVLVIVQIADITEMKQNREHMEKLAFYDTLTDLANRRLFNDRLEQAVKHAVRTSEPAALMYLDLDNFKRVNDTLGHEAGDELLRAVAERVRTCVRDEDTVGRPGGDEFTILLNHVHDARAAGKVARKIIDSLDEPIRIGSHELRVTTSIGVTLAPEDGTDTQTLMKNADLAMYRAKERGRDTYQFFSEDMNTRAMERLVIENQLRTALDEHQFALYYQPKVRIDNGEIVGVEALLRWNHPTRGLLAPDAFIQVAEESGLIVTLGEWSLHEACRQVRGLHELVAEPMHVAVNLSARQFADPGLVDLVGAALASAGLDAKWLELEITETMLMEDIEEAILTLDALRQLGVSLSIDDFGTGYSSLNYLKRLPIDYVKVDRSFVSDIPQNADDMAITAAVVAMAHRLDLRVVAEGVETPAQLEFLKEHRCEYGQGYLFGPPLPFERIGELMTPGTPLREAT